MISLEGFSFPGVTTTTTTTDEPAKDHEKASPGDPGESVGDAKKDGEEEKDWITEITDNLGLTSSSATTEAGESTAEEGESWVPSLNFQLPDPFAPSEGNSANAEATWPAFPNFWEQPPEEEKAEKNAEPTPATTTDNSSAPWDIGGLWGSGESKPLTPPAQSIEAEPTNEEAEEKSSTVQDSQTVDPEDKVKVDLPSPQEDDSKSEFSTISLEREDSSHDDNLPTSEAPTDSNKGASNEPAALMKDQLKDERTESMTGTPANEDNDAEGEEEASTVQNSRPVDPEDKVTIDVTPTHQDDSKSELTTVSLEREDSSHYDILPASEAPPNSDTEDANGTVALKEQLGDEGTESATGTPVNEDNGAEVAVAVEDTSPVVEADSNHAEPTISEPDAAPSTPVVRTDGSARPTMKGKDSMFGTSMRSLMGFETGEERTSGETSPAGSSARPDTKGKDSIFGISMSSLMGFETEEEKTPDTIHSAEAGSEHAEPTISEPDAASPTVVQSDVSARPDMKGKDSFFGTSMRSLMGFEIEEESTSGEASPVGSSAKSDMKGKDSIFGISMSSLMGFETDVEGTSGEDTKPSAEADSNHGEPTIWEPDVARSPQEKCTTEDECDDCGKEEGDSHEHSSAEGEAVRDSNNEKSNDEAANITEEPVSAVADWLSIFQSFVSSQMTGVVDMVITKPRHPKFHKNRAIKKTWTFPGF